MNLSSYFHNALVYEDYVQLLGENLSLHKLHYNNFIIQNDDAQKIKILPLINILVEAFE
ncbi:MAG: hypothetical protein KAS18_04045 [Calditrichia bacterium]|nr:hypothetical protein [Calditrichia bacterium]